MDFTRKWYSPISNQIRKFSSFTPFTENIQDKQIQKRSGTKGRCSSDLKRAYRITRSDSATFLGKEGEEGEEGEERSPCGSPLEIKDDDDIIFPQILLQFPAPLPHRVNPRRQHLCSPKLKEQNYSAAHCAASKEQLQFYQQNIQQCLQQENQLTSTKEHSRLLHSKLHSFPLSKELKHIIGQEGVSDFATTQKIRHVLSYPLKLSEADLWPNQKAFTESTENKLSEAKEQKFGQKNSKALLFPVKEVSPPSHLKSKRRCKQKSPNLMQPEKKSIKHQTHRIKTLPPIKKYYSTEHENF
jgi:hypothetical protein